MNSIYKIIISLVLLLGIVGCASVNTLSPEERKSGIVLSYAETPDGDKVTPLCPITETYMVMPEEGGKVGTVDVAFNNGDELVLHGDYSSVTVAGEQTKTYVSDSAEMTELFGTVLAALPEAPFTATLYFISDSDVLDATSKQEAENIYNNIVQRQAVEVSISGHTDTVGSEQSNIILSKRRANTVRRGLIQRGVSEETIKITAFGESKLLVETDDNTNELKNRRVEINVR